MDTEPSLMVKCDCSAHAIEVSYWNEYSQILLSVWYQGFNRPMSLRERLRWCWHIIKTGNPWADSIIVNKEDALRITKFIKEHVEKDK